MKFTNRSGKLRFYDATGTPWFLQLAFDNGDFSGPIGAPKVEELLQLNRGKMDAFGHYIKGAEDKIMNPVDISFSADLTDVVAVTDDLLAWLAGGPVNAHALVTTKATTQRAGGVNCPAFADANKKCSNIQIFWDEAGTDQGYSYNESYFDLAEQSVKESAAAVTLDLKGKCYGTIVRITAFTAGTTVR